MVIVFFRLCFVKRFFRWGALLDLVGFGLALPAGGLAVLVVGIFGEAAASVSVRVCLRTAQLGFFRDSGVEPDEGFIFQRVDL